MLLTHLYHYHNIFLNLYNILLHILHFFLDQITLHKLNYIIICINPLAPTGESGVAALPELSAIIIFSIIGSSLIIF
jgi:hypothetical protein